MTNEHAANTLNDMNVSLRYYVINKKEKPYTKEYMLYDSICIKL